ncbi:MAG: hypothetical protein JXN64_13065 [Spirochaetes bacterium]|nr:hypothetical protein [Spirochaetota bacterium]
MNKYSIKPLYAIILFIIINVSAHAEKKISTGIFFNKNEIGSVLKGGIITKSFLKYNGTVHTPDTDTKIILPDIQYIEKDLASYEMISIEKAFFACELTGKKKLYVYNILASAAKLSGMQYYSRTDSKIQTLITNSGRIKSPDNKWPVKDILYSTIYPKTISYFSITDNRFGDLTFKSELYNEGENFILKNVCIEPMEKYFISINKKEEYHLISIFIYDNDLKGFFYYSINAMRIRSNRFLKLGILSAEHFANRIRGSTVHMAKLLGIEWEHKIKAFE